MTIEKAVTHIANKIARNKYSSTFDKECVNRIIEYVNNTQQDIIDKNLGFYKLYAYLLGQQLNYYQTTVDDPIPHIQMAKLVKRPAENVLTELTDTINNRYHHEILDTGEIKVLKPWTEKEVYENLKSELTNLIK